MVRRFKRSFLTLLLIALVVYVMMLFTILVLSTANTVIIAKDSSKEHVALGANKQQDTKHAHGKHPDNRDDRNGSPGAAHEEEKDDHNGNPGAVQNKEENEDRIVASKYESDGNMDYTQHARLLDAVLGPRRSGQLRSFVTREFIGNNVWRAVGTFLTRVYDSALVAAANGYRGATQLMPYYNQTSQREKALLHMSPGIVDVDNRAMAAMIAGAVDETLLLVFNDWDHRASAFIAQVGALAASLPLLETVPPDELPWELRTRLSTAGGPPHVIATVRRGAFAALWQRFAGETSAGAGTEAGNGTGTSEVHHFFMWPQEPQATHKAQDPPKGHKAHKANEAHEAQKAQEAPEAQEAPKAQKIHTEPSQIIAAVRPADFDGSDTVRGVPFAAALQSPRLFFCSSALRHVVPFTGAPDAEEIAAFVATHTISSLVIESFAQLRRVLSRLDRVALFIGDSVLLDALLDRESGAREVLRALRPTFYVRAGVLDLSQLMPRESRDLTVRKALRSLFTKKAQAHLAPLSDASRLLLLDRVAPGDELNAFVVRAVRFAAPLREADLTLWGQTVAAQIADAVRDAEAAQPFLRRVTGLDVQFAFEKHMRMSFAELRARWRGPLVQRDRNQKSEENKENDNSEENKENEKSEENKENEKSEENKENEKSEENKENENSEETRLFAIVLAESRGACSASAFAAAASLSANSPLRIVAASPRGDLAAELRFAARTERSDAAVPDALCEVFVLDARGTVRRVDMSPRALQSAAAAEEKKGEEKKGEEKKGEEFLSGRLFAPPPARPNAAAHPPPSALRTALRDLKAAATARPKGDVGALRSAAHSPGAHGAADWFLWVPPREPAPLVVHLAPSLSSLPSVSPSSALASASAPASVLLLQDSSCGVSTNSLKAHRLLAQCRSSGGAPLEVVEYDLSDDSFTPSAGEQLLHFAGKERRDAAAQRALYERLEPFLLEAHRLQPPQLVAVNGTHVVSTLGTASYYHSVGKIGNLNGHAMGAARIASYMDSRIDMAKLLQCMQDKMAAESQERELFRK